MRFRCDFVAVFIFDIHIFIYLLFCPENFCFSYGVIFVHFQSVSILTLILIILLFLFLFPGNMGIFLPVVLESIGTNRHQYLLLASLKEIILVHANQGLDFSPFLDSVLPGLLSTFTVRTLRRYFILCLYYCSAVFSGTG